MSCGVALARKAHIKKIEQRIDYLNLLDTTIMGSRNNQVALYLWYGVRKKVTHSAGCQVSIKYFD